MVIHGCVCWALTRMTPFPWCLHWGPALSHRLLGTAKWGSVVWVERSLEWSLQSECRLHWHSRMWRNSIPTGTSLEFMQRGKLHWENCFCPSQCLETFSNELVFIYTALNILYCQENFWQNSVWSRSELHCICETIELLQQEMTRTNSQGLYLSEVNEPFPPHAGVLPLLARCAWQQYLSSLWAMWPGHLVQVCLLASLKFAKY